MIADTVIQASPPKIAISCGDLNGVGLEILIKAHPLLITQATPLYCLHFDLLRSASELLGLPLPPDLLPSHCLAPDLEIPTIEPKTLSSESGRYSYESFILGCKLCDEGQAQALLTLPIHKKAWDLAAIPYAGHTQALRSRYGQDAIMLLGCEAMFVALFTDHIPLQAVCNQIRSNKILDFLLSLYHHFPQEKYCVLGLNPHCGDGGVLGEEDGQIYEAIQNANTKLGAKKFWGPYASDAAFIPTRRAEFGVWVAMYHDVGLAPLKALHFDESINVSLGLPILRVSVDHGVGFDIAYSGRAKTQSYLNAISYALKNHSPNTATNNDKISFQNENLAHHL